MSRWSRAVRFALVACLLAAGLGLGLSQAAEDKEPNKKKQKVETKARPFRSATAVDFAGELKLDLRGLRTIGARIDQARLDPDPVALALIGKELEAAEKVSGKSASVKSEGLFKEAAGMAKARNGVDELKVVALLLGDAGKGLTEQAEKTAKEIEKRKGGEEDRGIVGNLTVKNHTLYTATVYINGFVSGTVGPLETKDFYVGAARGTTTNLRAVAVGVGEWDPQTVFEDVLNVVWDLK